MCMKYNESQHYSTFLKNTTVFKTSCVACLEEHFCGNKLDDICKKKVTKCRGFFTDFVFEHSLFVT